VVQIPDGQVRSHVGETLFGATQHDGRIEALTLRQLVARHEAARLEDPPE
jgi:hypothetical protein